MEKHWNSLFQNRPLGSYSWVIETYKQLNENKAVIILTNWLLDNKKVQVFVTKRDDKYYAEPKRIKYEANGTPPFTTINIKKWGGLVYHGFNDPPCNEHFDEPCSCLEPVPFPDSKEWPINNFNNFSAFMNSFFGTKLSPGHLQSTIKFL